MIKSFFLVFNIFNLLLFVFHIWYRKLITNLCFFVFLLNLSFVLHFPVCKKFCCICCCCCYCFIGWLLNMHQHFAATIISHTDLVFRLVFVLFYFKVWMFCHSDRCIEMFCFKYFYVFSFRIISCDWVYVYVWILRNYVSIDSFVFCHWFYFHSLCFIVMNKCVLCISVLNELEWCI